MRLVKSNLSAVEKITIVLMNLLHLPISALFHHCLLYTSDTERSIAYNYEMQMCRTGKINGVNYQDTLYRGIEVDGDSVASAKIQFDRALLNSQISNILKQAGVYTPSIKEDCIFTVDPYSYEITVDGVDEETKVLMQNALNVPLRCQLNTSVGADKKTAL